MCGLLLDEWTEVLPAKDETVGMSFSLRSTGFRAAAGMAACDTHEYPVSHGAGVT